MARLKVDYGIDLGTTNSAICRMEKGEPVIKKTDTLKDTLPSCVSFTKKKGVRAGDAAYNDLGSDRKRATLTWAKGDQNTFVEFKRTMGTDTHYPSSFMGRSYSSEELSAEVLKTLKSFITDEKFNAVVITVPAKFTVNQKTATMEAARLAGFSQCELLQEPIAAAMVYGVSAQEKDGVWLVFDFGGGTFDAALLRIEDGIMQVFDTEGDNYLGGKDLDFAIVDSIILPYLREHYAIDAILADPTRKELLREAMKTYAEKVKNQLSFKKSEDILSNLGELGKDENGEEIELDLTVSQEQAFAAMRPYFQKAVDICKELLRRNNLRGDQLSKLILVGGPTHSPLVRSMLKEQVTPNVDENIDPMTAVASGAALYASTIEVARDAQEVEIGSVKLKIGYEATSVETNEWISVKPDRDGACAKYPDKLWVEFIRNDGSWASGKVELVDSGSVIEVQLVEARANSFAVRCYDAQGNILKCFPEEITIIQGSKIAAAPLPYHIGIAVWDERKSRAVFVPMTGLEKNKPVPAIGVRNDRKTSEQLRPGVAKDQLRIPVYQVDGEYREGRTAALYEYVTDVVITGDEVTTLIPAGSPVEVTLKVDTSEQMTLEVYFPTVDFSVSKQLDTSKKQSVDEAASLIPKELKQARESLDELAGNGIAVGSLREELDRVQEEHRHSTEKKAVLQHLKEVLRKIEDLEDGTAWQRIEQGLRSEFNRLEKAQKEFGDDESQAQVEELRSRIDSALRARDEKLGANLLEEIQGLFFRLTMPIQLTQILQFYHQSFSEHPWRDAQRARQLINRGLSAAKENDVAGMHSSVMALFELLPESEQARAGGLLG